MAYALRVDHFVDGVMRRYVYTEHVQFFLEEQTNRAPLACAS